MKITSFQIENIGVHYSSRVEFGRDANQLIFLNGNNNYGKTTILDSLKFCLFGTEIEGKRVSKFGTKDLLPGEKTRIEVRISLDLESGERAIVTRSMYYVKAADQSLMPHGNSQLSVTLIPSDLSKDAENLPVPDEWLKSYFPIKFQDFILFNGEKLQRFFSHSLKSTVEQAVRESARIQDFDDIVATLGSLKEGSRKKVASLSKVDVSKLELEISGIEGRLNAQSVSIARLKEEIEGITEEIAEIEPYVRGLEAGDKYIQDYQSSQDAREAAQVEMSGLQRSIREHSWSTGLNSFFIARLRESTHRQIDIARNEGRYPADFAPEAVRRLIHEGTCICGRHLVGEKSAVDSLENQISRHEQAGEIGRSLLELNDALNRISGRAVEGLRQYNFLVGRRQGINARIKEIEKDLKEIEPLLEGVPLDQAVRTSTLLRWTELQGALKSKSLALEEDLRIKAVDESDLKDANTQFKSATQNSESAKTFMKRMEFLDRVIEQSGDFSGKVLASVRSRIEEFVNERFESTVGGGYRTVVKEDFSVVCYNEDGTEAEISSGQEMLRAYFFSFALRGVVGMEFPLIVDSPVGRIDGPNRDEIVRALKDLMNSDKSKNQQAIFLMIDSEYTPDVHAKFRDLNPQEFYLNFVEKPYRITTIERGLDPNWEKHGIWKEYATYRSSSGGK